MSQKIKKLENLNKLKQEGLCTYHMDKDACGVGVVANIKGKKSNTIVQNALEVLVNLEHRGACGCDPETGDGAGITIQIPDKFIRKEFENLSIDLPKQGSYATGIIFLPSENSLREKILDIINSVIKSSDTGLIRLKDVPTNPDAIGEWSRDAMPSIKQIFIENIKNMHDKDFSKELYILRKRIEKKVEELKDNKNKLIIENEFYFCSLSNKIIIYKGLLKTEQVSNF